MISPCRYYEQAKRKYDNGFLDYMGDININEQSIKCFGALFLKDDNEDKFIVGYADEKNKPTIVFPNDILHFDIEDNTLKISLN